MGYVYYKYKSANETFSVPVPYSSISVSELKKLILTSNKHGRGRTRGRGPREDIVIYNDKNGEEFDESTMIPQNSTVVIRRTAGQLSENIVLLSSRKVIEDGTIPSNMSVVTESTSKSCSSAEVQDEDAAIASVMDRLKGRHLHQAMCVAAVEFQAISFNIANRKERHLHLAISATDAEFQGILSSIALPLAIQNLMTTESAPNAGLQVVAEDHASHLEHKLTTTGVDLEVKDEGNSAGLSVEKAVPTADARLEDGSKSISKVNIISGTLEPKTSKTDQPKKKRKKGDSTKIVHPSNANYDYSIPFDPAYYNPYVGGYPWLTEPYMYGSMGMPYGGYPMGPYDVNSIVNMPLQFPSAMQGNLSNTQSWETQSMLHRPSDDAARPRMAMKPKEPANQSRSSERNVHLGSSHGTDSRKTSRSSSDRREHRRASDYAEDHRSSDYADDHRSNKRDHRSSDYAEDHRSNKRMRASSPPTERDRHSRASSRHSSRSRTYEDSSDDERNFKRRWGGRR
uniref:DWNN domain-containing protein n=1 Tax=Leersia perrieri TaxID=77586 RepID=A0A0D9VX37_9ORYZ